MPSLRGSDFRRVATAGPEFLLLAREHSLFRNNLEGADLRVPDGFGITLVSLLRGARIRRFPGADILHEILERAEKWNLPVFLAIRKDGLSSLGEIKKSLLTRYPRLLLSGIECERGAWEKCSRDFVQNSGSDQRISFEHLSPVVVLSNFGAPEQEYFLESLRGKVESVRLVMGVGGSFDFVTGRLRRAPALLRALGFEWLWRLFLQPHRFRRILRAVFQFPYYALKERRS
ncbi:MAG: WecB/TagA/CpsF family glycosyltransferase [Candidatus Moraniibacteriota bacterium]|nr:MAG: WecB/TagA/CpsF family glycosyltransferase [Candidatus Moranbacteria bacterium]